MVKALSIYFISIKTSQFWEVFCIHYKLFDKKILWVLSNILLPMPHKNDRIRMILIERLLIL